MNKNRKKIVISLSLLAILFVAIIGVSYAYYMANVVGNNDTNPSLSLKSGYLSITYTDGQEFIPTESDGTITQDKAYTKTFTVTNSGVMGASYSVWLKDVVNPFTRTQDWTYTLSVGDNEIISSTVFPTTDKEILVSRYLGVGKSETLTLSVTYASSSEDQSADLNKTLEFNVSVVQSEYANPIENAPSGTLLYSIKRDNTVSEPLTTPGQQESTEDEAVLATTEDDYGTSYYFRGNVTNNYMNYSGMCWRIVRVQGDGTIKLALADENGECNAETYSTSNTKSAFVNGGTGGAYKSSMAKNATDFPFETSNIPSILSSWSTSSEHTLDTSKLVETEWCNDTAKTSESGDFSYYGAYDRLKNVSSANPTLKCNTKGVNGSTGTEANAIKYKNMLGILSADEVAFAGSTYYQYGTTYNYYLQTNASGNWYWTLSPYYLNADYNLSYVWRVDSTGYLYGYYVDSVGGSVRPSIVINADVKVNTNGNGTQTNPYEVATALESAPSGTLLKAIGKDNTVSEPLTVPGREASTSEEAVLATTEDDYGTSYYFRGNVTNNYVNYSGMCWRIVRVQGDGTIKLALADENGECNASTYSTSNTKSAFIDGRTDVMYKSGSSYTADDLIFENSDIPAILSSWATNKSLDASKLVDAEWCNDTAKTSSSGNVSYYGPYDRLYNVSTANPTLKCNTKGMEGTSGIEANAQIYKNKLGILSADEVAFAGATTTSNNNYYLKTNSSYNWYFTMSPYNLNSGYAPYVMVVGWDSNLSYGDVDAGVGAVRLAIVLKSNVTISSGNGTQTNPYVIN